MRFLFLLFLLANVAFGGWLYLRDGRSRDAQLVNLQMNADQVRLVAPAATGAPTATAPASPAPTPAKTVTGACLEWAGFTGAELARAETVLASLELGSRLTQREASEASTWWVYVPPLKGKAEIERQIADIKAHGITEYFVVQDGQWKNAISLGIFRSEEAATAFLATVREKGLKDAVSGARGNLVRQTAFLVRDPDPALLARIGEIRKEFPGTDLKAVGCPPG